MIRMIEQSHVEAELYDEPENQLITGEAVALDLRPASFILRAAGTIIDWLLYLGVYILAWIFLLPLLLSSTMDSGFINILAISSLVVAIVVVPTTVELLSHGKSLGKLAVGARIVRDDGGAIGFRHAFIRALTGVLEIYLTFGGFAAITGFLGTRSKRLGDLLAGTYSQYERVSHVDRPVFGVPVELLEWSKTADVARLPSALARRIAQFLAQANGLTPPTRERLSRDLATEASVYVSPIPVTNAELFLAAVSAIRRERESAALALEKRGLDALQPVLAGLPHRFPQRGVPGSTKPAAPQWAPPAS
jgi:uncharacterized RDD family membrane protein YckC